MARQRDYVTIDINPFSKFTPGTPQPRDPPYPPSLQNPYLAAPCDTLAYWFSMYEGAPVRPFMFRSFFDQLDRLGLLSKEGSIKSRPTSFYAARGATKALFV